MVEKRIEKMNIHIDYGEDGFFSDTVTVSHTQNKFVIDFTQTTPRFDFFGEQKQQSFVIKHKTIILDPIVAKNFLNILKDNMKKYEKQFGTIKIPKRSKAKSKKVKSKSDKQPEPMRYIG